MQKIYVLLRQDKQTGPYSLQELLQFDLKPYDLIWIEGQSAGWYYPQEIAALHPYLRFLPKKHAPIPQVPPAEKKLAAETTVTTETPLAGPLPPITAPLPIETYKPFKPASENLEKAVYAQFNQPVVQKEPTMAATSTPQKKNAPNSVVVAVTAVLIVGGVFAASWILNRQPAEEPVTETTVHAPVQNENIAPAVATNADTKKEKAIIAYKKRESKKNNLSSQKAVVKQNERGPKKENVFTPVRTSESPDHTAAPSQTAEEQVQQKDASSATKEETTAPQEKKKTAKDRFLDLFRKKPEEKKEEERRTTGTENGERTATRRESNLLQAVHVRFDVPNDWMMGIKGAKATLVNRSTEKIKSTTVEVLYYNDDDELLQKKVVTFGRIDAKESGTITIPDHPTATKVDYKVLSVTGLNQPPA